MKKKLKLKKDNIILIILVVVFLFATTKIILFVVDLNTNKSDNKKLVDEVIDKKVDETEEKEDSEKIDFDKLLSINDDTIGWIRFNNDKVNNVIVHTTDNSYYLNHNFNKKKNQAGTIFMDYRNTSFDDKNVVLFGHNMTDNTMFGSLKDVFKDDFFKKKENNYIKVYNKDNELLTYQIFSYYIIEKEEYYITTSFSNDDEFSKFIDTIRKRSKKKFDIDVNLADKILTLSSCEGFGGTTKRRVISAKRIENNE